MSHMTSEKDACLREYLMYFKKMQRIYGVNFPQAVDDVFNQCFLRSLTMTSSVMPSLAASGSCPSCQ